MLTLFDVYMYFFNDRTILIHYLLLSVSERLVELQKLLP